MAVDPKLYFELTQDELREVTRFALTSAEEAAGLLAAPKDPRITDALDAARRFADGAPRSNVQRVTATAAHRVGRDADDTVTRHAALAAGDAAASANLHPFAKGEQVGHILRSTAHAALAAAAASGSDAEARAFLDRARERATPMLREVLHRYPPFPAGRTPVAQLVGELDTMLREG